MSDPFVGQIRMFAGNFAPRSYSLCDGQLLAVSQNDALFSLFGTIYGGDGITTFGLPDLRGRLPIHQGSGPGLSNRRIGAKFGVEKVTLTSMRMPSHTHNIQVSTTPSAADSPAGKVVGLTSTDFYAEASDPAKYLGMAPQAVANTGGSQEHNNLMPALCLNFIVALFGVYPSRN